MPELRQNPVTGQWVIIATERARRPQRSEEIKEAVHIKHHDDKCFFCFGNEETTPPEIYSERINENDPDTPGWLIRVVNNKFAALNMKENFLIQNYDSLYKYSYATGTAEVVIETPHHSKTISKQSLEEITRVLRAYQLRYKALKKEPEIKYILLFRNCGALAGASLEHPHSQIIGVPVIPPDINTELSGAQSYYEKNGRCVFCDMIQQEIAEKLRIIYENELFIAFEPYASRYPFETQIFPKFHSSMYENLNNLQLESLAEVLKASLYKIDEGLDNPPYNYFIHTAPTQQNVEGFYHWHLEIIPKLTIAAGFELGTGMFINVTIPEQCADFLHQIEVIF